MRLKRSWALVASFSLFLPILGTSQAFSLPTPSAITTTIAEGGPQGIDKRDDLRKKQAAEKKRQQELEASLEGLESDLAQVIIALDQTQTQLPVVQAAVDEAQAKLDAALRDLEQIQARLEVAQVEMQRLADEITEGENRIVQSQVTIGEIARQAYRGQGLSSSIVSVVLGASSTEDLTKRMEANRTATRTQVQILQGVEDATAANRNRAQRQTAVTERIGELELQAKEVVERSEEAKKAHAAELANYQHLEEIQGALTVVLSQQKSAMEAQLQEAIAAQAAAAAKIAAIDEENRRLAALAAAQGGSAGRHVTGSGLFSLPVAPGTPITSGYGNRTHPVLGYTMFHAGTDWGAACGVPQYAAQDGTVQSAFYEGTGGNSIYINHGIINGHSYVTVYRHFQTMQVSPGQKVARGQQIGLTGTTGRSTGCHCHFEVWRNGATINPLSVTG
ncbi:MAG: peptidoglycan DD-metalloendopeptidase family protein [Actinomycetaceae bacterium]|nr:peptidoglycan DD-metalloendopeptidase family protein [Actinomycetaceae bacterium]